MARGNQREVAREKRDRKERGKKTANTMPGTAFQRKKEDDAAKMRAKQANADAKKAAEGVVAKKKK